MSTNHLIPPDRQPILGAGQNLIPVLNWKPIWVASNVIILPSFTVGEGAVFAANAGVNSGVKSLTIGGGDPAMFIGPIPNEI